MAIKKLISNNDGIALVTSLMMTLISLTIVMAVMYMITQNNNQNRLHKDLQNSFGGILWRFRYDHQGDCT